MLTFDQALDIQAEAEGLMSEGEHDVDSSGVLELVRDSACSAYDCEVVLLARTLAVRLVTMDAALLRAFPKYTVPLRTGKDGRSD